MPATSHFAIFQSRILGSESLKVRHVSCQQVSKKIAWPTARCHCIAFLRLPCMYGHGQQKSHHPPSQSRIFCVVTSASSPIVLVNITFTYSVLSLKTQKSSSLSWHFQAFQNETTAHFRRHRRIGTTITTITTWNGFKPYRIDSKQD